MATDPILDDSGKGNDVVVDNDDPVLSEPTVVITSSPYFVRGETKHLQCSIMDGTTPVNTNRVVFKVKGKTVKDENGKIIYVDVVDGQAGVDTTITATDDTLTISVTYIRSGGNITASQTLTRYDSIAELPSTKDDNYGDDVPVIIDVDDVDIAHASPINFKSLIISPSNNI